MRKILLGWLLAVSSIFATVLTLTPSQIGLAVGEVTPVKIFLQDHPTPNDIAGVSLVLTYNAKLLQIVDSKGAPLTVLPTQPPFSLSLLNQVDNETGVLRLALGSPQGVSTPQEVLTFHVRGIAPGTTRIEWVQGNSLALNLTPFPWEESLDGKSTTVIVGGGASQSGLPSSSILPLNRYTNKTSFPVSWYSENPQEVAGYQIQYKIGSGAWQDWLPSQDSSLFTTTQALFGSGFPTTLASGESIAFRSRALSTTGFWEPLSSTPDTVTTVDLTSPELSWTTPQPNSVVGGKQDVQLESADDVSGIAFIQLFVDNQLAATLTTAPYRTTVDWTAFSEGPHTLLAAATDLAGNRTEKSLAVRIDNTPPTVTLEPLPAVYGGEDVWLIFHGSDNSGIASYDLQVQEGSGPWQFVVQGLTENRFLFHGTLGKTYTFRVRARDLASLLSPLDSPTVKTTLDASYPNIVLLSPPLFVSGTFPIEAKVSSASPIQSLTFLLDQKKIATFSAPPYRTAVDSAPFAQGWHPLEVQATDAQGKTSSIQKEIFVDRDPPHILPLSLSPSANAPFPIAWQANDNGQVATYDVDFSVNGGNFQPLLTQTHQTSTTFGENGVPVALSSPTTFTFRARATDAAGNISSYTTASVFYAPEAPFLRWKTPETPLFVRAALHNELLASSNTAHIALVLDGKTIATLTSPPFTVELDTSQLAPYNSTTCPQPKDAQGFCPHLLEAQGVSTTGVEGAAPPLRFYVDNTPPLFSFDLPSVVHQTLFTLQLTGSDEGSGLDTFEIEKKVDSAFVPLLKTSASQIALSGQHGEVLTIRARAIDKVGNATPFIEKQVAIDAFDILVTATAEDKIAIQLTPKDLNASAPTVRILQNGAPLREATLLTSSPPYLYTAPLLPNYDGPGQILIGSLDATFPFSSATLSKTQVLGSPDGRLVADLPSQTAPTVLYLLQNQGIYNINRGREKALVFTQISPAYELGPKGRDLQQPMKLTYRYDPQSVLDPVKLSFYRKENGAFTYLQSQVNLFSHTVSVSITQAGTYAVFLDTMPPEVVVDSPKKGAVLDTFRASFHATLSDQGSGVDFGTVAARIDGRPFPVKVSNGQLEGDMGTLSAGNHSLEIQVKDRLANTVLATHSFSVKERALDILQAYNYPNPTSGETTFRVLLTKTKGVNVNVELYTATGHQIGLEPFSTNEVAKGKKAVQLKNLANGVYFCRFTASDGSKRVEKIHKLVILR